MAKPTLKVITEFGTFTRQTARKYTHLVIVKGHKAERLEARRLEAIANGKARISKYRRTIETGECQDARPGKAGEWDRKCTADFLASGEMAQFLAGEEARVAELEAQGVITEDQGQTWTVLGWCGRLQLARNLANSSQASLFRHVEIIDVAAAAEASAMQDASLADPATMAALALTDDQVNDLVAAAEN